MMNQESGQMMIFSLVEYGKNMTQYVQIEGKKHKIIMPLAKENYTAQDFWKTFKKTGKRQSFGKYATEEYIGISPDNEVGQMSIWISQNPAPNITGQLNGDILGLYGVGYLYEPNKKTYFYLVHFSDSKGNKVTLTNIEGNEKSVNLNGYTELKMPSTGNIPNTQNPTENPNNSNNNGNTNIYQTENMPKYSVLFEQIVAGFEQGLPSLKSLQNDPNTSSEQKQQLKKQVICIEKSVPIYKKAISEMKKSEAKYPNNTTKLQEEYARISEQIDQQKTGFCD